MRASQDGVSVLWAGDRVPVMVLLDDPTPCRNPMWYEFPDAGHVAEVPNAFVERFADLIERTGAAGKFSVVPCPGACGRIDEGIPGVDDGELAAFVRLVRERIAPRWDVCPELLTHNWALDLATMRPLPEREDVWAAHQDEATLAAYIGRALQILRNVGLQPNGVTSPWSFGREVEDAYAGAIAGALRDVCDVSLGWYFLHVDAGSTAVPPRVMRLDTRNRAALVSIVSASATYVVDGKAHYDFAWRTQLGEPARIDLLLSADGSAGRLVELFDAGGPLTFHTHWQSIFSNGTGAGLVALGELFDRINRVWGDRVRWTAARELATYCAARAATSFAASDDGRRLTIRAPFTCPAFTFSVPMPAGASTLRIDGAALERLPDGAGTLHEGAWRHTGAGAHVCVALRDGIELVWR